MDFTRPSTKSNALRHPTSCLSCPKLRNKKNTHTHTPTLIRSGTGGHARPRSARIARWRCLVLVLLQAVVQAVLDLTEALRAKGLC